MNYTFYTNFIEMLARDGAEKTAAYARDHGFSSVEVLESTGEGHPHTVPDVRTAQEVRRIFEAYGLSVACYSVGCDVYQNPAAEEVLVRHAEIAGALGCPDLHHTLKSHLLDQICMTMGGRVAEKVAFTDVSTGAIQDLKQASEIARKMVEEYGMSDAVGPVFVGGDTEVFIAKDWGHSKNYSEALAAKIDVEMRRILEEQFERAESIIASHKDRLIAVSEMLLKYERVTGEQFEAVYRGADADAVMQGKAVSEPSAPAAAPAINENEETSAGAEPME